MSVSGISSSAFYNTGSTQSTVQQFQQAFQQLGQDLQSGDLSAAQSAFAVLQQLRPQNSSTAAQSNNPVTQAFSQLSQDLQSGNLSAAQKDYTALEQAMQNQRVRTHHHRSGSENSTSGTSQLSQLIDQLGASVQSGSLSTAQTTYNTLLQALQQFAQTNGLQTDASSQSTSSSNRVSVNA
ncbi:MAG: hypothetical protein WAK29_16965 [Terriglobales bacterium]